MPVRSSDRYLWLTILGAGVMVAVYIYIYTALPLPGSGNEKAEYLLICLAALSSAVAATLTWHQFPPADRGPRGVWGNFALAFWLWAIAEAVAFGYSLQDQPLPLLSAADVFWLVGYVFFAGSLIHQYHLIYRTSRLHEARLALGIAGAAVIVSLGVALLVKPLIAADKTWLEVYVSILYPFLDLAVGLSALWLVYAFGGRLWSRSWLGLFVFTVADTAYAVLVLTGVYDAFVDTGNPLGLVADAVYIAAYLVVTVACVSQWLLLRYGLPRAAAPKAEEPL